MKVRDVMNVMRFGAGIGERERGSQAPQGKQDQRDAGFRW